ncbi:type II toxin-antitoxin system HicB family antitoxin [Patescibacteria group bacterium]
MKTKILTFRTMIQKDGQNYHGYVPSLPGCHSQGKTIEETRKHLKKAIIGVLKTYQKHGLTIPNDEGLETLETISFKPKSSPQFSYA